MTTVALSLRDSCRWAKTQNSKKSLVRWDFGDAKIKIPSCRSTNSDRKKSNENLVIKYNSKSTLRWLDTWNQQCFTLWCLFFSRWKVDLLATSEKNRVFEKQFRILAKNAIENSSQSNLLNFYWGGSTANLSVFVLSTKQNFHLIPKKVFTQVEL